MKSEPTSHQESRRTTLWFLFFLWILNTPFLLATFIRQLASRSMLTEVLHLTGECNAGAWWSGMQLLLFGLICLAASGELSNTLGGLKRPLIVLGLVGLALSADEMGSIHEQVSLYGTVNFGSGKLALLPFAIIGGGAVTYSVWTLYKARASVGNVWLWFCIGFGVFGLVWVQEHVEHAVAFEQPVAKAWRAVLEEGSELLGFAALLTGGLRLRLRLSRQRSVSSSLLPNQFAVRASLLLLLIAMVPVTLTRLQFSLAELDYPRMGDFGLVIPVQLFAVSSLVAIQLSRNIRKERVPWMIVGVVLAGASLAVLASYPDRLMLGTRIIAWRADLDMFVAVPALAICGFLIAGMKRVRLAVFVVALQLSVTALILSRKEWADLGAPYLVSVPVVFYLIRRFGLQHESSSDGIAGAQAALGQPPVTTDA